MENVNSLRLPTVNPIRYLKTIERERETLSRSNCDLGNCKLMLFCCIEICCHCMQIMKLLIMCIVVRWNCVSVCESREVSWRNVKCFHNFFFFIRLHWTKTDTHTHTAVEGGCATHSRTYCVHSAMVINVRSWKNLFDGDDEHECTCPRPFSYLYRIFNRTEMMKSIWLQPFCHFWVSEWFEAYAE